MLHIYFTQYTKIYGGTDVQVILASSNKYNSDFKSGGNITEEPFPFPYYFSLVIYGNMWIDATFIFLLVLLMAGSLLSCK